MSVDLPEVHARALDAARRSVAGVSADQWDELSDCDPWTVRELVNHVVTGNYWAAELGSGFTIEAVGDRLDGDVLGSDPLRAYDDSSLVAAAVFRAAGAMEAPCAVSYGPVPGVGVLRAPVPRRADPRMGRRHVDRSGHHARSRAGGGLPRGDRAADRHARRQRRVREPARRARRRRPPDAAPRIARSPRLTP